MLTFVLALQAAAIAAPAVPATLPTNRPDIVVTGVRLQDSERAWKDCRRRNCPPDQEIHAALVHGENLFVAGDYQQAQAVVTATVNATRGAGVRFPVEVGEIRRAQSTIASHQGDPFLSRQGMIYSGAALKAGLGDADARVLNQRLLTADSLMQREPTREAFVGGPARTTDSRESALRAYEDIARDAARLGQADIGGRALLRRAALLTRLAASDPDTYERRARRAVAQLTGDADPRIATYRKAALVLGARLDAGAGDTAAIDRLVTLVSERPTAAPILLYAPPLDWNRDPARRQALARRAVARYSAELADAHLSDQWIDVAFRVGTDGRVEDAQVLRASDTPPGSWTVPVLASIEARRYAHLAPAAAAQLRVERHTLTATSEFVTGTRIEARTGLPRVAVTDLTNDVAAAGANPAAPAG